MLVLPPTTTRATSRGSKSRENQPNLRKTRLCPHVTAHLACPLSAEECRFAHSAAELRVSIDRFYKVQPCAFFDRGTCRNGDLCRFAHGTHELRAQQTPRLRGAESDSPASSSSASSTDGPRVRPSKTNGVALFLSAQNQRRLGAAKRVSPKPDAERVSDDSDHSTTPSTTVQSCGSLPGSEPSPPANDWLAVAPFPKKPRLLESLMADRPPAQFTHASRLSLTSLYVD